MTETVVHVTTLEQWKSVLDVWFEQGYKWNTGDTVYAETLFSTNEYLILIDYIYCDCDEPDTHIEYSEFVAQQKEENKMATVDVTQEQFNFIETLKRNQPYMHLVYGLTVQEKSNNLLNGFTGEEEKSLLRYLGGDDTIEFKAKEPLYRLWSNDENDQKVYFLKLENNIWGTPVTNVSKHAFTAPLEEIKKWQTPAWEIEKAE